MSAIETMTMADGSGNLTLSHHHLTPRSEQTDNAVQAEVSFLKYRPEYELEKLYTLNYSTEGTLPRSNVKNELKTISIQNFRKMETPPSFDSCGFAVGKLQTSLKMIDFDDSATVEDLFYPEVEKLMKEMFPEASAVKILEHQIRKRPSQFPYHTGKPYKNLLPTTLVHIDFTPESAAKSSRAAFKDFADQHSNLLAVNLWKSLQGPGDDWPLALCDARTVDPEADLVPQDIVFADKFNENARMYYNEKQKWYYYPDLQADEIVVFRQMDSRTPFGGGVPHTGFFNPHTSKDAAPRASIETRAFVYFK